MHTSEKTRKDVENWIDSHAEEIIADLQAFSRIRSVSVSAQGEPGSPFGPECRKMLDFAMKRAGEYGFDAIDHEGYCLSTYSGDLSNALGIFGHLDVVPEGDQWIYPPYGATREGDFLIGRGVSDNKSACAMGLHLLRLFRELQLPLKHGVRVVMGLSEETGMQDMEYFAKHEVMPVISLVPDSHFPVNYAQKGTLRSSVATKLSPPLLSFTGGEVENMVPPHAEAILALPLEEVKAAFEAAIPELSGFMFEADGEHTRILAGGIAAHAASPESGESAIHILSSALCKSGLLSGGAREAMEAVSDLSGDYHGAQAGIDCEDPETGKTTMVVGVAQMDGGEAVFSVDSRLSIAADLCAVESNFRAYADRAGLTIKSLKTGNPFYMKKDDPRVQALMNVYVELTGDDAQPYTMGGGTYSRCLENALTFGPGFETEGPSPDLPEHHGGAHAPDEYIHLPAFIKAMKIYALSLLELDVIV